VGTNNEKLYGTGLVGEHIPRDRGPLAKRFVFPPFSVWNTREGFWQDRKRRWLGLGIQSEQGRDGQLTFNIPIYLSDGSTGNKIRAQTSIFDPVLTEICYTWWCPPGGIIIDPFAGGSVRGIVASVLGYRYWGCELRAEQVASNRSQLGPRTTGRYKPKWVEGDSSVELENAPEANFLFSCPPYGNLEKYSDDPADISNHTYTEFLNRYDNILGQAVDKLQEDSFAVLVVANYRDKKTGQMQDFVGDTTRVMKRAGAKLYNEAILINAVGSAAMRANTSFLRGARKLVKSHQNVLVYVKGDERAAATKIAPLPKDEENNTGG
jgi:hypothetical protein